MHREHACFEVPRYLEAKDRLLECGLRQHPLDQHLFEAHSKGKLIGVISVHFDGMLIAGDPTQFQPYADSTRSKFNFRTFRSLDEAGVLKYC